MASSTQNIAINISSNVSGAVPGINSVTSGLTAMSGAVGTASTALGRLPLAATAASSGITNLSRAIDSGQASFAGLANGAGRVVPALNQVRVGSAQAGNALTNLGRVASDAPFGFIAIQNNLDPLFQSFRSLQTATGSTGGALKALGQSLIGPAGVGLAFTAITGLITVAIQKYGSLGNAIDQLNPFLTTAAKAQGEFAKATLDGGKAAQEAVVGVDLLYKASQDLNIPLEQRRIIVGELQKQFPETFAGLSKETILAGGASKAYEELKNQLIQTAVVKAANAAVEDRAKELFSLQLQARKTSDAIKELQKSDGNSFISEDPISRARKIAALQNDINVNKAKQAVVEAGIATIQQEQLKIVERFGVATLGIKSSGLSTVADITAKLATTLSQIDAKGALTGASLKDLAGDKLPALNKAFDEIAAIGGPDAQAALVSIGAQIEKFKAITATATKPVKSISTIVKALNEDLRALDVSFAATGGSLDKLSQDKINRLSTALKDLSDFGIAPGTDLFDTLQGQIQNLQSQITHTPVNFKIPINIEPLPAASNANTIASITDGVKQKFRDGLIDVSKIVNDTLKSTLADGLATVAEGIGAAFSGGGIQAVLGGFIGAISAFGSALGKQLVAQGVALIAFNASLQSLNGITSIIAGVALIAASAAFKGLAGKGVSSFATGGGVYSPTLAMIGDNPGREEYVIPSEVLDKMGGGSGGVLETRISANDLVLLLNRAQRNG